MSRRSRLLPAAIALILSVSPALAAPPTDGEIDAFITKVTDSSKDITDAMAKSKATIEAIKSNMGEISWGEATPAQLDKLAAKGMISPSLEMRTAVHARLKELTALKTVDGARAGDILVACWPQPKEMTQEALNEINDQRLEVLVSTLKHPAAADLFKAGKGVNLIRAYPQFRTDAKERKLIELLEPFITTDLSPLAASALWGVSDLAADEQIVADAAARKRIAGKIAAAASAAIDKEDPRLKDDPKMAESTRKTLRTLNERLTGAWARGELLDHPAPPIDFVWTNSDQTLKSFADLKGKVVMVDFWATWCGPCVASFPKVRQLAERYKDYPVAILGITSQQGYHIARKGDEHEKIDCEDFKREQDFMAQYIKDMKINWTIAFSDKNCFNPDFGVQGIPHIAIIAPDGKVRFNGLRPGEVAEDAERIDKLLKEFKLPCPTEPIAAAKSGGEDHP